MIDIFDIMKIKKYVNKNSKHSHIAYYVQNIALKILYLLSHLIFTTTLWAKHCYYPHFTDGKTEETKKHQVTCPRSAVIKQWSWDSSRGSMTLGNERYVN